MGATCVTTEVTGHEEYVEHGVNALVVDWDDLRGTARQLDLLARDRVLLHRLRRGALDDRARVADVGAGRRSSWPARCSAIRREPPARRAAGARAAHGRRARRDRGAALPRGRPQRADARSSSATSACPGSATCSRWRRRKGVQRVLIAAQPLTRPIKRKLLGP